ncbi:YopT-type cysteine protease domain-containing protein [Candidatus Sororendozoicomonas aggregata]|uniref:YopT-type cysteine protease domain-containing protein n=1 Tax=Candidatus Sororendozoicomonas aggregata TaxID=3073239 RepID=UPI002ED1432D
MDSCQQVFEESARQYQGVITWPFDQDCIDSRGVCLSLCAHWIRYHSMGKHLSEELYDKNDPGKFNQCTIGKIQALQGSELFWIPYNECYAYKHHEHIISWLRAFGLCLQTNITTGDWTRSFYRNNYDSNRPPHHNNATYAASLMLSAMMKYISCYLLIVVDNLNHFDVNTGGSGHVFCAWFGQLSGGDVCFFDPNFGEVWFEQRDQFALFAGTYLEYFMLMNHYTHWDLLPVVKPAFPLGM